MSSAPAHDVGTDADVRTMPMSRGASISSEVGQRAAPVWFGPTMVAMTRILGLPEDWNHEGAKPVDPEALEVALRLLARTASAETPPPDVVPTVAGGVQLEWHRCRMDVELEVSATGSATLFWQERDTGNDWEGPLSPLNPPQLADALRELTERHEKAHGFGNR